MQKVLWLCSFLSPFIFIAIVTILGFIAPNYSHSIHTISQLALTKYGVIQQLNFIQFALCLSTVGHLFHRFVQSKQSKRIWLFITHFSALFFLIETIFPSDQMTKFSLEKLTLQGTIHYAALALFFLLAPFGVNALQKSMRNEPTLQSHATFTATIGYTLCILCYVWTLFFITGSFVNYLGLFQKIIALICLYWFIVMLWKIRPKELFNQLK